MAIPSFGPSQRLEISRRYLNYNETRVKGNEHLLYGPINPKDNVAEEGQVVLLWSEETDAHGGTQRLTEVIPDAAGYPIDRSTDDMSDRIAEAYLEQEISKYNIGVNQVERGVGQSHISSGFGWDISLTPGHPVVIKHTGYEPIYRFDLIGVRFPNKHDIEAQQTVWGYGNRVSKFATYPIRENYNMLKHVKFVRSIQYMKDNVERGMPSHHNPPVQYLQIPAFIKLLHELYTNTKNDNILDGMEEVMRDMDNMSLTATTYEKLLTEEGLNMINNISKAACEFVESLNPPVTLAQCIDFRCTQSQAKSHAECGDQMKCVLL